MCEQIHDLKLRHEDACLRLCSRLAVCEKKRAVRRSTATRKHTNTAGHDINTQGRKGGFSTTRSEDPRHKGTAADPKEKGSCIAVAGLNDDATIALQSAHG